FFDTEDTSFFAMEYLLGNTLDDVLVGGNIPAAQSRTIALQLAEGLGAAHRQAIVHGDFKPANVILTTGPDARAVITDFGLARAIGQEDVRNKHSMGGGTVEYMAPELFQGARPTVQSDLFAYGKVLQKLLPKHPLLPKLLAPLSANRPASIQA